jgi:hypothetical protein
MLMTGDRHSVTVGNSQKPVTASTSSGAPIVFIVDDDVSVRESLELLVVVAGFRSQTFASALDFLARPRVSDPSCFVLDVTRPGLDGRNCRIGLPPIVATCRSFSSVVSAMCRRPSGA